MGRRLSAGDLNSLVRHAQGLKASGLVREAEAACKEVLAAQSRHPGALQLLGLIALDAGDAQQSIRLLTRAVKALPASAALRTDLGRALLAGGRAGEAERELRAATRLDPGFVQAHLHLGYLCQGQRRYAEAEACHRTALMLQPDSDTARYNLGASLQEQGRYEEALDCYRAVLERNPAASGPRTNAALIHLLKGMFEHAWADYRARPPRAALARQFPALRFADTLPQNLRMRDVLLLREQGLGDELFFLRFAPELKARGACVRYWASPKIAGIVARSAAIDQIVDHPHAAGDFVLPVGDLPGALAWTGAIPRALELSPQPERVAEMRARLEGLPRPWLGVAWRAGAPPEDRSGQHHHTVVKEVPLVLLSGVLRRIPGSVIVIQREPGPQELQEFARGLGHAPVNLSGLNDDLESMLALLGVLDDYVGVSSTNTHLRAGLGQGGEMLVPSPPEWRWLAEGERTPWFPECRVHRQGRDGDWSAALASLEARLRSRYGTAG